MPQNTTKNVLISVALIAFIISSGAFTIYQLAKKQTNTNNNPAQVSIQKSSSENSNLPSFTNNNSILSSSVAQSKELAVNFDPYICGVSITGFVDKPDLIQSLQFALTNKDKSEIKQAFTPKIDESKNFKILVDDKNITDGVYKLEATAILADQKSEITETTIEFKKDCGNIIQNSTPSSVTPNTISTSISSYVISTQSEIKTESPVIINSVVNTVESSQQAIISSQPPQQTVKAPEITVKNSSLPSLVDNTNNPNAVRTGGLDVTGAIIILMVLISTALLAKLKTKQINLNEIFGRK